MTRLSIPGDRVPELARPGRLDATRITEWADAGTAASGAATAAPSTYICGPTRFVELASDALVASGVDPMSVRTERFGGA